MSLDGPPRRALVWGANGFIGHALVSHLVEHGWAARALVRASATPPVWSRAVECLALGTTDRERTWQRALEDCPVVFNLAGSSGAVASNDRPIDSLDANCRVQLEFLAACERAAQPVHVVFASSRLVYAPAGRAAVPEDFPVAPLSVYGAHKLCVEHYHRIAAQRGALTFTICRISNPFGLDESAAPKSYGFINTLIRRALAGERLTLFGAGQQLRDYLYIDDLVTALRLCAERPAACNQVLNLGGGSSIALRDAALLVQRHLGSGPLVSVPWPKDHEAVEGGDFVFDIGKARAALDWSPTHTFEDGLARIKARAEATDVSCSGIGSAFEVSTPPSAVAHPWTH